MSAPETRIDKLFGRETLAHFALDGCDPILRVISSSACIALQVETRNQVWGRGVELVEAIDTKSTQFLDGFFKKLNSLK